MAKILTNDTNTTPQAGGSICALKTIKLEVTAAELIADAVFDLGAPPEGGFKFLCSTTVSNVDTGVGFKSHLGTDDDASYYAFGPISTSASVPLSGGYATGSEFAEGNIKLKVFAVPTSAQDGLITVTLYGWS